MSKSTDKGARLLLTIANRKKLERIYKYLFDENEFLSDHGIRALSKFHKDHPFALNVGGRQAEVDYEPAESTSDLFGGNSNWRGPIWFPLNFLMIESLQRVHYYYGDEFKVEYPTRSGQQKTLWEAARDVSQRLSGLFLRKNERRPVYGDVELFQKDPHWRDLISFFEYFNGDTGEGLGASHQTGWTALVAKLIEAERGVGANGKPLGAGIVRGWLSWKGGDCSPHSKASALRSRKATARRADREPGRVMQAAQTDGLCHTALRAPRYED